MAARPVTGPRPGAVAAALLVAGAVLAAPVPPPSRALTIDRTLTVGSCHYHQADDGAELPDPACTPGRTDPRVTPASVAATICAPGWTAAVRPASSTMARWADRAAGAYETPDPDAAEYDHLIPLELGGANALSNLWPEPGPIPNAKDRVENALHRAVCAGRITLADARARIARDWTTASRGLR